MSPAYLERLFRPRSVAVVGANNRPQRVGSVIMRNLLAGGFEGPIMPVNPRYEAVAGILTYPDVSSLPRTPDLAVITRAGVPVAYVPVERVPVNEIVKKKGKRKTDGEIVIANSITQGHFRVLTGFEKSDQPAHSDGSAGGGRHANHSERARQNQNVAQHYDVISIDVHNDGVKIRLPRNGGDLNRLLGTREDGRPHLICVDAGSSDGSLSLSLGIVQSWAEANADAYLTTISSNYFRPSDAMLRWAAALPNLWVGATVSGWFSEAESEARWAGIERLMAFDVPTVIWITTHPSWDNESIVRRAKKLVGSDRIIEAPYLDGDHAQRLPLLGVNALGACGDARYDGKGRRAIVVSGGPGDVPQYAVETEDGTLGKPYGTVRPQCRGCSLKCGFNPLFGATEDAEDETGEREAAA
jgi:hypothetical protein